MNNLKFHIFPVSITIGSADGIPGFQITGFNISQGYPTGGEAAKARIKEILEARLKPKLNLKKSGIVYKFWGLEFLGFKFGSELCLQNPS